MYPTIVILILLILSISCSLAPFLCSPDEPKNGETKLISFDYEKA